MADKISGKLDKNQYCLLYPKSEIIRWFMLDGEYEIKAIPGKKAYDVAVRVRLKVDKYYPMTYTSLDTILNIACNEESTTSIGHPSMSIQVTNGGTGPYTEWFHYRYNVTKKQEMITLIAVLDLSRIKGILTGEYGGPDYEGRWGQHFNQLVAAADINVSDIEIGKKPSDDLSLENRTPYKGSISNKGISNAIDMIRLNCITSSWGDPVGTLYWSYQSKEVVTSDSGSIQKSLMSGNDLDLTNLFSGVTYTITAYIENNIGKSNTASITVRTRHHVPEITRKGSISGLEQIIFNWCTIATIDIDRYNFPKTLKEFQYRIGAYNGWNILSINDVSEGEFTISGLSPGRSYDIYIRGTSSDIYDGLNSTYYEDKPDEGVYIKKYTITTLGISYISNIISNTFGEVITIEINAPSTNNMSLLMWVDGDNGNSAYFTFDNISRSNSIFNYSFSLDQSQLDSVYKCFTNKNYINMHFILTTIGSSGIKYTSAQFDTTLVLTGIAKTAYIGINGISRRAQIWVGDSNNTPRRAVGWVGVDNKVRRST